MSARPVTPGEYVSATSKIATIVRVTPIKLELQIPELYAPQMKRGLGVEAAVSGYAGRVFNGTVTAVNPAVDPNSRTFIVEVTFAQYRRGAAARHVRDGARRASGQHAGHLCAAGAVITDPDHQFLAGLHDSRRQGTPGGGAAG